MLSVINEVGKNEKAVIVNNGFKGLILASL
jgi:hypothetical protein